MNQTLNTGKGAKALKEFHQADTRLQNTKKGIGQLLRKSKEIASERDMKSLECIKILVKDNSSLLEKKGIIKQIGISHLQGGGEERGVLLFNVFILGDYWADCYYLVDKNQFVIKRDRIAYCDLNDEDVLELDSGRAIHDPEVVKVTKRNVLHPGKDRYPDLKSTLKKIEEVILGSRESDYYYTKT